MNAQRGQRNLFLKLLPGLGLLALLCAQSAQAQAPYAKTQPAAPVRATTATLNGMAVPRGQSTFAWFEWGTNTAYGNVTAPQYATNGTHVVRITSPLTGLSEGGIYHFRLVASNSVGVTRGFDFMFTTAMKIQNWGAWDFGIRPLVPAGLTNISGIAAGHRHSLAIHNDGTVVVWIASGLGTPAFGQTNVPAGLINVVSVAGGFSHCMALTDSGTVVSWGRYADGTSPDAPPGISNVIAVAGGDTHSVALKSNGTVAAWGRNPFFGGVTNVPVGLVDVVAISCGSAHTLALKADGTVTVWGTPPEAITAPSSATNLVAVATMGRWNIALRGDGTTVEWGDSFYSDVPKPANVSNVVAVTTGYGSAEVLKADGTLVAWGRANDVSTIPAGLTNVLAIASGDYYMMGLAPGDLPPVGNPAGGRGGTNSPLTVSLSGFDPNGDSLGFKITALPATGSLYQYTPNGPGDPIAAPGTFLTDPARVIFMPSPGVYGDPSDSFAFVANDGVLDSAPVTCQVATVPTPWIQSATVSNGPPASVALAFSAISNASYSVWRSTNLTTWTSLGAAVQTAPGQFTFTDNTISNTPVRFYRIRSP